ncbi:MAG: DUF2938 family protein [Ignavibacteria bacterium]|nr:DUF2938 family protein [Ignavibacteria bacterium]
MQKNFGKAIVAGFAGTLAMTMVMLMAPLMGMPPMPIGKMLADFMGMPEALGWIAHFMIGTALALIYASVFASKLPGSGVVRGTLFGLLPWLMSQVMVNPMMGAGIFASNTPAPVMMVIGSLMGHMIYGAVVGGVYGTKSAQVKTASAVQH